MAWRSTVNNANGDITFAPITYTLRENGGKTYYYLLTEVNDHKANITYGQEQYLIKAEVSDKGFGNGPPERHDHLL